MPNGYGMFGCPIFPRCPGSELLSKQKHFELRYGRQHVITRDGKVMQQENQLEMAFQGRVDNEKTLTVTCSSYSHSLSLSPLFDSLRTEHSRRKQ